MDERTGLVHDYRRKRGVAFSDLLTPDGGTAERAEARKDARTAREWVIALPAELNAPERAALVREFAGTLATRYGVAVDVALHQPDREGDHRNHHAHLLTTTRQVHRNADGTLALGDKASIELSDKARRARGLESAAEEVIAIRQLWEQIANRALERAGHVARIDARRLEAQGLDREATAHLGPVATAMERRTMPSDRGEGNRQVIAHNREQAALAAQIVDLQAEWQHRERKRQAAEERLHQAVEAAMALENARAALQVAEAGLIGELPAKLDRRAFAYFREVKDIAATEAEVRCQMVEVLVDSLVRRIQEAGHVTLPTPALLEEAAQRCYGSLLARLTVLETEEAAQQTLLSADIPALERELSEWTREREWLARHPPPLATWLADQWGELSRSHRAATAAGQALDDLETAYAGWRKAHRLALWLPTFVPGSKRREASAWEQRITEARATLDHAQVALAAAREAYDARLPAAECEAQQMAEEQRQQLAALQGRIDARGDLIQRAKAAQDAEWKRREAAARAEVERRQREVEQRKTPEPERPPAEPLAPKQEPPKFAIPAPRLKPRYPALGG